jgi:hypothetical protein
MAKKYVYFFGAGKADGNAGMKNMLGGKGANLAEMAGHRKLMLPHRDSRSPLKSAPSITRTTAGIPKNLRNRLTPQWPE